MLRLTNLDHEGIEGEGVVVEHDAADVADDLRDAASENTSHEAPGLPSHTQEEVNEAKGAEESSQGDIGSERGSVGVDAPLDGAVVEVAGGVGTEGIGLGDVGGNRAGHCDGCGECCWCCSCCRCECEWM